MTTKLRDAAKSFLRTSSAHKKGGLKDINTAQIYIFIWIKIVLDIHLWA